MDAILTLTTAMTITIGLATLFGNKQKSNPYTEWSPNVQQQNAPRP